MRYCCPRGCVTEVGMSEVSKRAGEKCEKHGERYVYAKALKRAGAKRTPADIPLRRGTISPSRKPWESKAEKAARERFNEVVKSWPCLFSRTRRNHKCDGELDAHHLIPKNFIRFRLSKLPESELLPILFSPQIGAPLCRRAHEQVTRKMDYVYFDELSEECLELVASLPDFMLLRLEIESPKRERSGEVAA